MAEAATKKNVYQRILAVAAEITKVEPTGVNQYGKKAYSIVDIENAIRNHMVEHGLVTRWSCILAQPTPDGKGWQVRYAVKICNIDDPDDQFEDFAEDIGQNCSAARSFAIKGYWKSLFHIAEDNDEVPRGSGAPQSQPPKSQPPKNPSPPQAKPGADSVPAGFKYDSPDDRLKGKRAIQEMVRDCSEFSTEPRSIKEILDWLKGEAGCPGLEGDDVSDECMEKMDRLMRPHYKTKLEESLKKPV